MIRLKFLLWDPSRILKRKEESSSPLSTVKVSDAIPIRIRTNKRS